MAEREFDAVLGSLEEGILHHSDRPEIEMDILRLLEHSVGPTTEGVAAELGVGVRAAGIHLESLKNANWAWSQRGYAHQMTWHISLEGRHYLAEHG
jgi:predicted ArsR family transcriptional regulator